MSGMMRFCFLVLMIAVAGPARAQGLSGNGILLDSYAAIVNGKVITVGEVLAAMSGGRERLEALALDRKFDNARGDSGSIIIAARDDDRVDCYLALDPS